MFCVALELPKVGFQLLGLGNSCATTANWKVVRPGFSGDMLRLPNAANSCLSTIMNDDPKLSGGLGDSHTPKNAIANTITQGGFIVWFHKNFVKRNHALCEATIFVPHWACKKPTPRFGTHYVRIMCIWF